MKKSMIAFCISLLFITGNVFAAGGNFGLGVIVGEPTGISAKAWTGNTKALDFAAAGRSYLSAPEPAFPGWNAD